MLFSSITFLYYFLPAVLILYFLAPGRLKNAVLLAASLFFYAWGEPRYVILMLFEIGAGYLSGLFLNAVRGGRFAKPALFASVMIPLGLLLYFKYAGFFAVNINSLTGLSVPVPKIALPIGISFYTFQIISYQVDVYRQTVDAQKNPIALAAYVAMFPQLIAGPIVRYADIEAQLASRTTGWESAAYGIRRFLLGLAKKILLANRLGELMALYRASAAPSVLFSWLYAAAFVFQVYFDFSGYSDMAIGLGSIFGFRFPENFRYPYTSGSITEFWRRWHISLGSWFRDYVYIPLGGNRVSKAAWFRNIFIVWFLTGFWHGAAWNFIVWGLIFAILLVVEKLWLLPHLKRHAILRHVYVLLAVTFCFVIFQATDMGEALADIKNLLGMGGLPLISAETLYYLRSYAVTFLAAAAGATPLPAMLAQRLFRPGKLLHAAEPVFLVVLLLIATAYLVDGSFNPFLYFRF